MVTRLLPPDEWPRLAGTELALTAPLLGDVESRVFVVEDDAGAIVGCWALIRCWHVEGLWIAEPHRKRGAVARRLLAFLRRLAAHEEIPGVVTAAVTPDVAQLLDHLGALPLPGTHYVLPLLRVAPVAQEEPACLPQ